MRKIVKCSRCHDYFIQTYKSRYGQLCRVCEKNLIAAERELSRRCGLRPMSDMDVFYLNRYWNQRKPGHNQ